MLTPFLHCFSLLLACTSVWQTILESQGSPGPGLWPHPPPAQHAHQRQRRNEHEHAPIVGVTHGVGGQATAPADPTTQPVCLVLAHHAVGEAVFLQVAFVAG